MSSFNKIVLYWFNIIKHIIWTIFSNQNPINISISYKLDWNKIYTKNLVLETNTKLQIESLTPIYNNIKWWVLLKV